LWMWMWLGVCKVLLLRLLPGVWLRVRLLPLLLLLL